MKKLSVMRMEVIHLSGKVEIALLSCHQFRLCITQESDHYSDISFEIKAILFLFLEEVYMT